MEIEKDFYLFIYVPRTEHSRPQISTSCMILTLPFICLSLPLPLVIVARRRRRRRLHAMSLTKDMIRPVFYFSSFVKFLNQSSRVNFSFVTKFNTFHTNTYRQTINNPFFWRAIHKSWKHFMNNTTNKYKYLNERRRTKASNLTFGYNLSSFKQQSFFTPFKCGGGRWKCLYTQIVVYCWIIKTFLLFFLSFFCLLFILKNYTQTLKKNNF